MSKKHLYLPAGWQLKKFFVSSKVSKSFLFMLFSTPILSCKKRIHSFSEKGKSDPSQAETPDPSWAPLLIPLVMHHVLCVGYLSQLVGCSCEPRTYQDPLGNIPRDFMTLPTIVQKLVPI